MFFIEIGYFVSVSFIFLVDSKCEPKSAILRNLKPICWFLLGSVISIFDWNQNQNRTKSKGFSKNLNTNSINFLLGSVMSVSIKSVTGFTQKKIWWSLQCIILYYINRMFLLIWLCAFYFWIHENYSKHTCRCFQYMNTQIYLHICIYQFKYIYITMMYFWY